MPPPAEPARRSWLARYLDWKERRHPDAVVREHRRRLLAGASGRVLELGCGEGPNFGLYPEGVESVLAVEPDALARARAQARATEVAATVRLLDARAEALPLEDATVDVAVCFWVLCSVADQQQALTELRRVLRRGGELRFYEHVRSRNRALAILQDAVDAAGWPRLLAGCHTGRDTERALREAGFEIVWSRRFFRASSLLTIPAGPEVVGLARPR